MFTKAFGLVLATALLAGCTLSAKPAAPVQKELRVFGPEVGMKRFNALQNSRRPPLKISELTFQIGKSVTIVYSLPANYTNSELAQTAREALAAGLSYEVRESISPARSTP